MSRALAGLLVGIDTGTTITGATVVSPGDEEISWGNAPTP